MKATTYYYSVLAEMQKNHKTMNRTDAEYYLKEKYPSAEVFTGVAYGGIVDIMIAQQYNPKAGEYDDEFTELEIVILN